MGVDNDSSSRRTSPQLEHIIWTLILNTKILFWNLSSTDDVRSLVQIFLTLSVAFMPPPHRPWTLLEATPDLVPWPDYDHAHSWVRRKRSLNYNVEKVTRLSLSALRSLEVLIASSGVSQVKVGGLDTHGYTLHPVAKIRVLTSRMFWLRLNEQLAGASKVKASSRQVFYRYRWVDVDTHGYISTPSCWEVLNSSKGTGE